MTDGRSAKLKKKQQHRTSKSAKYNSSPTAGLTYNDANAKRLFSPCKVTAIA